MILNTLSNSLRFFFKKNSLDIFVAWNYETNNTLPVKKLKFNYIYS